MSPDTATVQALRGDVALQIARHVRRWGLNQQCAAKQLGIPQPTLSKIINGNTSDLSLELLIRIAVRAGLPLAIQTGVTPQEAGAYVSSRAAAWFRTFPSKLSDEAGETVKQSERALNASQRLEGFLEHNELLSALHEAGRFAEVERARLAKLAR